MSIYDFEDRLAARHHRAQLGCLTAGVLAGGILGGLILGLGQLCLEHFAQKSHERREQRRNTTDAPQVAPGTQEATAEEEGAE